MNALYAITDSVLMPENKLITGVSAALSGGCRLVQYRDKSNDHIRRFNEAANLLALCHLYDAQLIINDDIQLAKAVGAHGVHLGQADGNPRAARALLGKNAIIGVTCHDSLTLARQAVKDGTDYVAFGRFFSSNTKPDAPPAPLSLLNDARRELGSTTIVAIGGITLENAQQVLNAGANLLAVSHNLFAAPDIKLQAQSFCQHQPSASSSGWEGAGVKG